MQKSTIGIIYAGIAGLSWGSMAVAAQFLFEHYAFTSSDLVCARLLGAGFVILLLELFRGVNIFRVGSLKNWRDLFVYGFALLFVQYSFFEAIRYTNAGTAAVVVAVGPALVLLYMRFIEHYVMSFCELACVVLCFFGVALLGTKGDLGSLKLSLVGLTWALASTASGSFATLFCRHLVIEVGVLKSVGWATTISGACMCLLYEPWSSNVLWSPVSFACYIYVFLVGTVVAFCCYLQSLKFVTANVASLVGCLEPLSGLVLSVALLGVVYGVAEMLGAVLILAGVVWLSWSKARAHLLDEKP